MPEATACSPSVVADTIMRTIELGVTITDAAVDEKQTTIFARRWPVIPAARTVATTAAIATRSCGR
ncbi:hypothetical protein IWGMT90018_17160 [Mycobacterium kiyosense]|nr:hypothetical protein IWGMT90018_17160 [Mycobacterium kiyosense]